MRRDDGRLRSRLATGLAAASAIAFVLTVAAVAASPAPRPDDAATAPPPAAATPDPTGPATPVPTSDPNADHQPGSGGDTSADHLAQDDTQQDEAGSTAAPTPSDDPSPPTSEEPPATPRVERSPAPPDHGAQLWDRWYRAEHLREGDARATVAGDHPLYVGFLRQEDGDSLVWVTSCNTFGGDVAVDPERLTVRDVGGTAAGCEEVQQEQEVWLASFFTADPHWRSLGERLRLWTPDGRRIDLVEDRDGPGPPWS